MPSTLPPIHSEFIERVCAAVAMDTRLGALLIGGSYIHGGLYEHSDLDFVVLVEEEAYRDVLASRMSFAEGIGNLISAFTGEHVGEPRLLICLYGPPLLHIDFKFVVADDLDHQIERRAVLFARDPGAIERQLDATPIQWPNLPAAWFEARAWVWLHYAITKALRGELYEAIGMLSFFREQVLGPMLYRRAGKNQRGVRRLETLKCEGRENLAATIAVHDAVSVRSAIDAAIDLYLDLRADDPPAEPTRGMPALLLALMEGTVPEAIPAASEGDRGEAAHQRLSLTSVLVKDYDEAIEFYVDKLGFELRRDDRLSEDKRWVVVRPRGEGAALLLARAADGPQRATLGRQAGGRVFLFLETDDFARDHTRYVAAGVTFREPPRVEPYGTVAVFEDLYGNPWDLIEFRSASPASP